MKIRLSIAKPLVGVLLFVGAFAKFPMVAQSASPAAVDSTCRLCFYGPDNIVFGSDGSLFLTDTDQKKRSRILKLSPAGNLLAEWHPFFSGPSRNGPEGIAIDHDGNLFVTDAGSSQILKLSSTGALLKTFNVAPGTFSDLGHIAIDQNGDIYVAQAGPNLIQKFSPAGTVLGSWHRAKGGAPNQWNGPETIAIRTENQLVVEDWGNRRLMTLSASGETLSLLGGAGDAPGKFMSSSGFCVDRASNIYVSDSELHRIQEFDPQGQWIRTIGNPPATHLFESGPGGVAIDAKGDLYSPDGLSIVKYSRDGKLLARWR